MSVYSPKTWWAVSRFSGPGLATAASTSARTPGRSSSVERVRPVLAEAVVLATDLSVQRLVGLVGALPGRADVRFLELDLAAQAQHPDECVLRSFCRTLIRAGVAEGCGGQLGLACDRPSVRGAGGHADRRADDEDQERDRHHRGHLTRIGMRRPTCTLHSFR